MKVTKANYHELAANVDTSALPDKFAAAHRDWIDLGSDYLDLIGDDEGTTLVVDALLKNANDQMNGGSSAPAAAAAAPAAAPKPRATPKPRTPKAAATPKPAAAPKPAATTTAAKKKAAVTAAAGNVRGLDTAVALIKGFVKLMGHPVKGNLIESKLRAIQTAMLNGTVTKSTPHAKLVDEAQDFLLKCVAAVRSATEKVTLEVKDAALFAKMVGVAGGETVFESVAVLKAFVKLSGKVVTQRQIDNLTKRVASDKIKDSDPFQSEIKAAYAALKAAKGGKVLNPAPVGLAGIHKSRLSGLAGVMRTVDRYAVRPVIKRGVTPKKKAPRKATTARKPVIRKGTVRKGVTRRKTALAGAPLNYGQWR